MAPRKTKLQPEIEFADPYHHQNLKFKLIPIDKLSVISHQRKPSSYHVKHLSNSIERIGFIVPVVVVQNNDTYTIIDGQHRYLAAKELGIREIPAIVVPQRLAQLMMNFNIEKELNIREKSHVAIAIYRQYLQSNSEMLESDPELVDSIEQAYYVTLGISYEKQEKLAGSSFEPILKKCDFFLDEKLPEALKIREARAEKVLEANALVKEIAQKLKDLGKWHPYVYQQIISYANPYKRKRLPTEFDDLFRNIIDNLNQAVENPTIVLKEELEDIY
ncbi:MAG: chromosome partitioning protein ParB [Candidatus Parcubacteria bacterium]|nr:MAG: chromosome partitioning protein ParB [Candidatus Parcubacteria bacterium]